MKTSIQQKVSLKMESQGSDRTGDHSLSVSCIRESNCSKCSAHWRLQDRELLELDRVSDLAAAAELARGKQLPAAGQQIISATSWVRPVGSGNFRDHFSSRPFLLWNEGLTQRLIYVPSTREFSPSSWLWQMITRNRAWIWWPLYLHVKWVY